MRYLILVLVMLAGCVPVDEWDDDGSGVVVWPEGGSAVAAGDSAVIVNRTGAEIVCWSPSERSLGKRVDVTTIHAGNSHIETAPRDALGGSWRIRCVDDADMGDLVREWSYPIR